MKTWLSQLAARLPRPRRRAAARRLIPRLELLESRDAPAVRFLNSFTSIDMAGGGGSEPPDTTMAVGPTRVLVAVNTALALYDKTGNKLDEMSGNAFHGQAAGDFLFDPIALYDEYAQRYVVGFLEQDSGASRAYFHIAVSNTSTPSNLTSDFTEKVAIEVTETVGGNTFWADYEKFGYNREAWVLSLNMFGFSGGNTHTNVIALDKSTFVDQNAGTSTVYQTTGPAGLFTLGVAPMHGVAAGAPIWMVSHDFNGGNLAHLIQMTNILSATPTYTVFDVTVPDYTRPTSVSQPDGSPTTSAIDARTLNAAWFNDRLVAAHMVGGNNVVRAAWYEFSTAGATPTLTQNGLIAPAPDVTTFYPAVEISTSGNIGMTYLQVGNKAGGEYLSMYMTGQQKNDPRNQMQPGILIHAGQADYAFSRQGDYAGIQIDPLDGSLWAAHEFAQADGSWHTGVGHVALGEPPVITSLSVSPNPIIEGESTLLTATFTDSDSANDAFRVVVDWGDGTTPTQLTVPPGKFSFSVQHQYADGNNGPTAIRVKIFDQDGNEGTGTVFINVFSTPPTAEITGVPPGVVDEGKKVSLGSYVTAKSQFKTFSYQWLVKKNGLEYVKGNGPGLSFVPDDQGVYDISLVVTDNVGGVGTAVPVQVIARNVAPTANGLTNNGGKKPGEVLRISFVSPADAAADVAAGLRYDYDTDGDGVFDVIGSASSFRDVTFAAEDFYTLKGRIRDKDGAFSVDYFTDVIISNTGGGNGGVVTTRYIAAGSDASRAGPVRPVSELRVFNLNGSEKFNLRPFGKVFSGGIRVATGDVNGDKVEDIIITPGPGGGSVLKVLNGVDASEILTIPNVYPVGFNSGVFVVSGDFNRDGFADYVVSPGPGQAAPVVGFSGFDGSKLFSINPFGGTYKSGISIAAGDVDGDRRIDLIAGQMTIGSQVKVFRYTAAGMSGAAFRTFSAMPTNYKGGVFVAAGDVNGDRRADIIVGSNTSFGLDSRVRVFSGANNAILHDFVPFPAYRMGVRVAADDLDGDGKADILVAPARPSLTLGAFPRIIGVSGLTLKGVFQQELVDWAFQGGVFVG